MESVRNSRVQGSIEPPAEMVFQLYNVLSLHICSPFADFMPLPSVHVVTFVIVFVMMSFHTSRYSAFPMALAVIWWILAIFMVALAIIVVLVKPENERYAEV